MEPLFPAFAGGFFTTEPPGKPCGHYCLLGSDFLKKNTLYFEWVYFIWDFGELCFLDTQHSPWMNNSLKSTLYFTGFHALSLDPYYSTCELRDSWLLIICLVIYFIFSCWWNPNFVQLLTRTPLWLRTKFWSVWAYYDKFLAFARDWFRKRHVTHFWPVMWEGRSAGRRPLPSPPSQGDE